MGSCNSVSCVGSTSLVEGVAGVFRFFIIHAMEVATNVINSKPSSTATTMVVYRHVTSGNNAYVPVATICEITNFMVATMNVY